ncbi:15605_t:CDS:2, partial [Funneliformis mosseae]
TRASTRILTNLLSQQQASHKKSLTNLPLQAFTSHTTTLLSQLSTTASITKALFKESDNGFAKNLLLIDSEQTYEFLQNHKKRNKELISYSNIDAY